MAGISLGHLSVQRSQIHIEKNKAIHSTNIQIHKARGAIYPLKIRLPLYYFYLTSLCNGFSCLLQCFSYLITLFVSVSGDSFMIIVAVKRLGWLHALLVYLLNFIGTTYVVRLFLFEDDGVL